MSGVHLSGAVCPGSFALVRTDVWVDICQSMTPNNVMVGPCKVGHSANNCVTSHSHLVSSPGQMFTWTFVLTWKNVTQTFGLLHVIKMSQRSTYQTGQKPLCLTSQRSWCLTNQATWSLNSQRLDFFALVPD